MQNTGPPGLSLDPCPRVSSQTLSQFCKLSNLTFLKQLTYKKISLQNIEKGKKNSHKQPQLTQAIYKHYVERNVCP